MSQTQFFLGGNTPDGFYSLYDGLSDPRQTERLYILKGGPGCGKSTLLRRLGRHAKTAGLTTEQVLCSGDPDSLDALVIPKLRIAVADGTAPHVMEAACPGAVETYVDLSRFYRHDALRPLLDELTAAKTEYQAHYREAYRCLRAAGELRRSLAHPLDTPELHRRLERRARGIIGREIRPGSGGLLRQRFLSAVTCRGTVTLWDTVPTLAERVYELEDSFGFAHVLLAPILNAALDAGQPVIACPDPMAPERLAHLILPECSLAFLTSAPGCPWPHRADRRIRLDEAADGEVRRQYRSRSRFTRKVADSLLAESVHALEQAKFFHDRLEQLYHPHVDFDGVMRTADALADEILP